MYVVLPVHVNDRGIHFVDGVSDVVQLTAQAAHDNADSLRSAIIKQLGGLETNKIHQESEYFKNTSILQVINDKVKFASGEVSALLATAYSSLCNIKRARVLLYCTLGRMLVHWRVSPHHLVSRYPFKYLSREAL